MKNQNEINDTFDFDIEYFLKRRAGSIKSANPKKIACCFCGKRIDENHLEVCVGCHDELSGAVENIQPPTDEEIAESQAEINHTDILWMS